jgi:chromosome segregation protein
VKAAVAARDAAIAEAAEAKENAQRDAAAKLRVSEAAMHRAQESEGQLLRERDELSRKLMALQREMHEQSQHAAQQAERWNQHGTSASEHEARLARLQSQLDEAEIGYRSARAVKATLEAELSALKQQRDVALEAGVALRAELAAERADRESAIAVKEKDAASWKAKWKAQAAQHTEAQAQLEAAEKRVLSEAADHAAALATRDARLRELETQLDSGRPQEQHMFLMAREQASCRGGGH